MQWNAYSSWGLLTREGAIVEVKVCGMTARRRLSDEGANGYKFGCGAAAFIAVDLGER